MPRITSTIEFSLAGLALNFFTKAACSLEDSTKNSLSVDLIQSA